MPWTKLRTAILERLAPSLRDRVAVHQARYRHAREEVGRVWVTLDRRELASFDTSRYIARRAVLVQKILSSSGPSAVFADGNEP
jgi:hypothetical protein